MDPHTADEALEKLLVGAPVGDEWRDVASFVRELQETIPSAELASEDLHVAAMVETAHLLAEKGDPAVRPVSNAAEPAEQASGLPKQRRKPMKRTIKILVPIAAAFTVFGGMAYAGALPWTGHDSAPTTISPSDEDSQGLTGEDDQGEDNQGDTTDVSVAPSPADEGDQGENADDQGESDNQGESSDDQGDQSVSSDATENDDNQGDNDNQGEDSQGDSTDQSGDSQGDSTDSTSGGDQGGDGGSADTTSGGDQGGGDSQG